MDFELEADKELVQCRAILDAAGDHSTSIHGGIDALISERRSLRTRVAELETAGRSLADAFDALAASYDAFGSEGPETDELGDAMHEKFGSFRKILNRK